MRHHGGSKEAIDDYFLGVNEFQRRGERYLTSDNIHNHATEIIGLTLRVEASIPTISPRSTEKSRLITRESKKTLRARRPIPSSRNEFARSFVRPGGRSTKNYRVGPQRRNRGPAFQRLGKAGHRLAEFPNGNAGPSPPACACSSNAPIRLTRSDSR